MHCASCEKGMDRYILLSERASYLSEPTEGFTFCGWDCVIAFAQKQAGVKSWVGHLEARLHELYQAAEKVVIAMRKCDPLLAALEDLDEVLKR